MKIYIIVFLVAAGVCSCTTQKFDSASSKESTVATAKANDTIRIANDELEYEVIIIDPGFNSWLTSRAKPRNFYNQEFLETRNRVWVNEWNSRSMQQERYRGMYEMRIDYEPRINYGYEVNYLIYNYLVYFQVTNRQKLGGFVPEL